MIKFKDFINKVVEIYHFNEISEVGKFLGLDQRFIYLENRMFYVEESKQHTCLGNAWISLDDIKQISVLDYDDDIIKKYYPEVSKNDWM